MKEIKDNIKEALVQDAAIAREEQAGSPANNVSGSYPTWIDMLAVLGLFVLTQFITKFVFVAFGWDMPWLDGLTPTDIGYSVFLWSIVSQPLLLILVLLYRMIRRGRWVGVKISMQGFNPTTLLWGVVMILSVVVVLEPLMELLPPTPVPEGRGLYMILALLVVAPIFEEVLCRGIIFEAVRSRYGVWLACIVSSLLFGLMHLEPQAIVNATIIGGLLSYIYLRTRSIFAPIILHSINNIFSYMFIIFGMGDLTVSELTGGGTLYTMIYCVSVGVLFLSMIGIANHVKHYERAKREKMGDFEQDEQKKSSDGK